ncbi:hypothetical protein CHUAL_013448 [Chamberlinius hualienensis]
MERNSEDQINMSTISRPDMSAPVPVPNISRETGGEFSSVVLRNPADRRRLMTDDFDDDGDSTSPNFFRLSTDSGMNCGGAGDVADDLGDEFDERRRHESVSGESGYGSPYVRYRPPALLDYVRSTTSAESVNSNSGFLTTRRRRLLNLTIPSSRLLFGGLPSPWTIRFPHQRVLVLGPFDPPQLRNGENTANSSRSIGTQTDNQSDSQSYVIDVDENGAEDADYDNVSVGSHLDDAFLDEGEENSGQIVLPSCNHLPDVVQHQQSWTVGRNRAHSVSFPVSPLDFSEPRDIGRCLSRIACDFDESLRNRRPLDSQCVYQTAPSSSSSQNDRSGFFAFFTGTAARVRRQRQRSRSASESTSWTNQPSVPRSRNVATNAPADQYHSSRDQCL